MVTRKATKAANLPAEILGKLKQYGEEFPRGSRVGQYRIQGRVAVVLDDGTIVMRCIRDGASVSCWKTIRSLRHIRTMSERAVQ